MTSTMSYKGYSARIEYDDETAFLSAGSQAFAIAWAFMLKTWKG